MTDVADRLQAEAVGELLGMPEGAPRIREFQQLRRREKQRLSAVLAELMPKVEALQGASSVGKAEGEALRMVSDLNGLFADMEDFCLLIAADPALMDLWVRDASEADLLAVFSTFTAGLGEAESSSN